MENIHGSVKLIKESEVVKKMMRKDKQAFDILYSKYWKPLSVYAETFISDKPTCEEVVQELFINLYTKVGQLNINSSLSSYLFIALRNRIFNYLRKEAVYKKHISRAGKRKLYATNNNVEQFISMMEIQQQINSSLNAMAGKYKEVYVLHEQGHYTIKEISALLNRPVDTVEKQLRKAVHFLREHLREYRIQS